MKLYITSLGLIGLSCTAMPDTQNQSVAYTFDSLIVVSDSTEESFETNSYNIDTSLFELNFEPKRSYTQQKQNIQQIRQELNIIYASTSEAQQAKILDSIGNVFTEFLLNEIIPHWYGTTWDFNGYTEIPQQGEIACGYFVSTTLRDMGFKLNRFRMAQQSAWSEAKTIAGNLKLRTYSMINEESNAKMKADIEQTFEDGFHIIGLDNHVGYLYKSGENLAFIHSSYYDMEVRIEDPFSAPCFESQLYVFAPISQNPELIKQWLNGEPIKVVLD